MVTNYQKFLEKDYQKLLNKYDKKSEDYKQLKYVKVKLHRRINDIIKNATISQVPSGKYYISILVETNEKIIKPLKNEIGIDLGIKDLCITSDGDYLKILK